MSAGVRVRRTTSPPPSLPHAAPRFPSSRHDHLDADERKAAASRGYGLGRKNHPPGGVPLDPAEWKLLAGVILIAFGVRLFRISQPTSVV
jgi:dolichyl-phosphate-mannose-protein mannosyltransferase